MADKASYKKYDCVGPGGKKCSCCYPAPGRFRRLLEKTVKRYERQLADKEIRTALSSKEE